MTSNHTMETTPETPATGAECVIPFEAEPEDLEDTESVELSEDVATVLDFCDERTLGYEDRLAIASALISDVAQEFEEDILCYVEEAAGEHIDPFIVANTSQVIERLRVVSEILSTVDVEESEREGDEFDEGELTG
jgi:hypothetical protein